MRELYLPCKKFDLTYLIEAVAPSSLSNRHRDLEVQGNVMSAGIRRLLTASGIAAGLVGILSLLDLVLGIPFSGSSMMMDIMFLVSSLLILYMVRQCFQELR